MKKVTGELRRENGAPVIWDRVVLIFEPEGPEVARLSASRAKSLKTGSHLSEDHIMSVIPDAPAAEQNEGVVVFWRHWGRPWKVPQLSDGREARRGPQNLGPELVRDRAVED